MIIVFNIFGVSRAELENSARILSVALICVCGLVVDHFIFCTVCFVLTMCIVNQRGLHLNILCHVILLHRRMPTFLTVIKYSVSS